MDIRLIFLSTNRCNQTFKDLLLVTIRKHVGMVACPKLGPARLKETYSLDKEGTITLHYTSKHFKKPYGTGKPTTKIPLIHTLQKDHQELKLGRRISSKPKQKPPRMETSMHLVILVSLSLRLVLPNSIFENMLTKNLTFQIAVLSLTFDWWEIASDISSVLTMTSNR